MNKIFAVAVGLLLVVLLVVFMLTYTVKYNEVAIRQTFGTPRVVEEAGLHFRLPVFVDRVEKLDRRLQVIESPLEEITTTDAIQIVVRSFLLWRIDVEGDGPKEFIKLYDSTEQAGRRLQGEFRTAFTGVLSGYRFNELVGEASRLAEAEAEVLEAVRASVAGRGVEAVAVGVNQIILPTQVTKAVLERMKTTRDVKSQAERRAGQARAEVIRSEGNTAADKIRSFANLLAQEIRSSGEDAAQQYLEEMNEDPDLAMFLISLDQLGRALTRNTTVILPADSIEPFHLLNPTRVTYRNGIPRAANGEARVLGAADGVPAGRIESRDDLMALMRALVAEAREAGDEEAAAFLEARAETGSVDRLWRLLQSVRAALETPAEEAAEGAAGRAADATGAPGAVGAEPSDDVAKEPVAAVAADGEGG